MIETSTQYISIPDKAWEQASLEFSDREINTETIKPLEDENKRKENIKLRHTSTWKIPPENTMDYSWKHISNPKINGHTAYEHLASEENKLYQELVVLPEKELIRKHIYIFIDICTRDAVTTIVDWWPWNGKMEYILRYMKETCEKHITQAKKKRDKTKRQRKLSKIQSLIYMPIDISQSACDQESAKVRSVFGPEKKMRTHAATAGSFFKPWVNDICKQSAYTPVHFCMGITPSNLWSLTALSQIAPSAELTRWSDIIQTYATLPSISDTEARADAIRKLKAAYGDPNPQNPYYEESEHARIRRKNMCQGVFASHGYDVSQLDVVVEWREDLWAVCRGMKVKSWETVEDPDGIYKSLTDTDPVMWIGQSVRDDIPQIKQAHIDKKTVTPQNIKIADQEWGVWLFVCQQTHESLGKKVVRWVRKYAKGIALTLALSGAVWWGIYVWQEMEKQRAEKEFEEYTSKLLEGSQSATVWVHRGVTSLPDWPSSYRHIENKRKNCHDVAQNRYQIDIGSSLDHKRDFFDRVQNNWRISWWTIYSWWSDYYVKIQQSNTERYVYSKPSNLRDIQYYPSLQSYQTAIKNAVQYKWKSISFDEKEVKVIEENYQTNRDWVDIYSVWLATHKWKDYIVLKRKEGKNWYILNGIHDYIYEDIIGKWELRILTSRIVKHLTKRDISMTRFESTQDLEVMVYGFLLSQAIEWKLYSHLLKENPNDEYRYQDDISKLLKDELIPCLYKELIDYWFQENELDIYI